jgi:hypothetical protein
LHHFPHDLLQPGVVLVLPLLLYPLLAPFPYQVPDALKTLSQFRLIPHFLFNISDICFEIFSKLNFLYTCILSSSSKVSWSNMHIPVQESVKVGITFDTVKMHVFRVFFNIFFKLLIQPTSLVLAVVLALLFLMKRSRCEDKQE